MEDLAMRSRQVVSLALLAIGMTGSFLASLALIEVAERHGLSVAVATVMGLLLLVTPWLLLLAADRWAARR